MAKYKALLIDDNTQFTDPRFPSFSERKASSGALGMAVSALKADGLPWLLPLAVRQGRGGRFIFSYY